MNQDTIRNLKRQYDEIPVPQEAKERESFWESGRQQERTKQILPKPTHRQRKEL